MARPLRIEYPGAFYHVTSRGNLQADIFFDEGDRKRLLSILKRTQKRYCYILHAYVFMGNHYHFLIETPEPNLKQIMQNINTSYTVYVNRKHKRSGHLFQGRYKAFLVDKDSYLLELSRYIHLNPVRVGIVRGPEKWEWSSYGAYLRGQDGLVTASETLSYFSKDRKKAVKAYQGFVEEAINKEMISPFKGARAGLVLGGDAFFERVKGYLRGMKEDRELPAAKEFALTIPPDEIIRQVAQHYGVERERIARRGKENYPRKVAVYLVKSLSRLKNEGVGRYFGIGISGVSNVFKEVEEDIERSKGLKEEIERIKEGIINEK